MELGDIVKRYAEGIAAVDSLDLPARVNQRTGLTYLPGVKSMSEVDLVLQIDGWWGQHRPHDFDPLGAHFVQVPYPGQSRNKCDQVITTDGKSEAPEWAIEVKYLQLVGDNGKRNDFAVAKALSPYLKDRSLYHDVLRLRESSLARRKAVLAVCFTYSEQTCDLARRFHPEHGDRINEIEVTCRANGSRLSARPLADFADGILRVRQLVRGSFSAETFEAWTHPCGGTGVVFGWEVLSDGDDYIDSDW